MGGGGFTGNNSVEWEVQGDHVRSHDSQPSGARVVGKREPTRPLIRRRFNTSR
jgi:hypothetical protein